MSDSAEANVTRRERPVGFCPRCHAVVRAFDKIGKKCATPLASGVKCPGVIRSALMVEKNILSNDEARILLTKAASELGPHEYVAPVKGAIGIILNDLVPMFPETGGD